MQRFLPSWRAYLHTTLDLDYITIQIDKQKAKVLESGLEHNGFYFLTLEAGFDVEIVKVVASTNGILTLERGQQGTVPGVWPAGTPIQARIRAKTIDDLKLDLGPIMLSNEEILLAPNGDIITKPLEKQ